MKKIALLVGALTALVGTEARAETDTDNFNPQHTFRPNEFPWTSGPIGLPFEVDVALTASAYHEVDIEMQGEAEYDFDAQALTFTGDADGGLMENALGVEIGVEVTFGGSTFEIGVYNIEETANGTFSPYLLPGDVEAPFLVGEGATGDLADPVFNIPGTEITVTLDIDWQLATPEIEYRSTRILLTDGEDSVLANEIGVYDLEDENLDLILPDVVPGETSQMYGTLYGVFDAEVAFRILIGGTIAFGDLELSFDEEVELDYPVNESEEVEFPVEVINFDVPAEPEPGTSTGAGDSSTTDDSAGDSTGDGDSDSDGTTTGADPDPTTSGGDESSGGLPAADPPSDSGCGCTTNNEGGGFAWMLGLFGLTMLRRRRD